MGEILADPPASVENLLERRGNCGGARVELEIFVNPAGEVQHRLQQGR